MVIRDCSFTIAEGKLTVMIGPSGCGKEHAHPAAGGFRTADLGHRARARSARAVSGNRLVSVDDDLPQHHVRPAPGGGEPRRRVEFLLDKVGLGAFRRRYPTQLSGGMQRRAELARAMINEPSVMILDEPFRVLDATTKQLMQEYYANLYEEARRTTFFVTTDIDEAIFLADRILVMTNVPARVRSVLDANLPRPPRRLEDVIEDDDANLIKMHVLSLLHEEAMKSFARGSKAATDFIDDYAKRVRQPS
jgi:NitT/TauT family transport system ATP-binding protein